MAAVSALLALGGGAARANEPGRSANAAASSCDTQVAAYRKWITAAPRTLFPRSEPEIRLVEASGRGPEWTGDTSSTGVRPTGLVFEGRKISVAGWRERIHEWVANGQLRGGGLALQIDRDAKWSLVADVVGAAAAAGVRRLDIVLARRFDVPPPPGAPPPLKAPTQEDLEWRWTRHPGAVFEMLERALRPCRPAEAALSAMGGMAPDQKASVFVDDMPKALLRCGCSARPVDAEVPIYMMLDPDPDGVVRRPYVAAVVLTSAAPGARAAVVRAPKDMLWSSAFRRVVDAAGADPGGQPLRLEVGGN